jgi:RNA polymerase sigma-70 factor (ECF subfamily)
MSSLEKHEPRGATGDSMTRVRSAVRFAVRRVVGRSDPDYEDLIQSCLVSVLTTLDRGDFRGECPPTWWASVVARNVAIDAIRLRARERKIFTGDGWEDSPAVRSTTDAHAGPEQLAYVRQVLDRIERILASLGPNKGRAVYLHDVLGYHLEEVAAMLGTTVAAAQSRLVRGRRELFDTMSADSELAARATAAPARPPRARRARPA